MRPRALQSCLGLLFICAVSTHCSAATSEQVNGAIARGVGWLYSQQQANGTWETMPLMRGERVSRRWGGHTAIAVYALLAAGEKANSPKLQRAIEFLEKADEIDGTYALGLRAQVWWLLPSDKATAAAVRRDTELLLAGCYESGPNAGFYTYGLSPAEPRFGSRPRSDPDSSQTLGLRQDLDSRPKPMQRVPMPRDTYDRSNSQYGVLGMWALSEAGGSVPASYWRTVAAAWKKAQDNDGGWDYKTGRQSTASMTAAGIATLYITQDFLLASSSWNNCAPHPPDAHIAAGLAWMDRHIAMALSGNNTYTMYGVERIGLSSGRKYFGSVPWFGAGAENLVADQRADGAWDAHFAGMDDLASTCCALLFLSRGRAPVIMNKLEYGASVDSASVAGSATTRPVRAPSQLEVWNERPRDLANLAKWVGRTSEGFYNWQTASLTGSAEDLHDAPILYIAGRDSLSFTDIERNKLRAFVQQGGLILGNADCGRDAFSKSFRELGLKLFSKYEFRELPSSHIIYTGEQYRAAKWKVRPRLLGLSNGIRELMILIPDFDPSRAWQSAEMKGHEEPFQLGANLFIYTTGGKDPRVRQQTWIVHERPTTQPSRTVKLARIQAGDNWDPEPAGWRRLTAILHNEKQLNLDVEPIKLGERNLAGHAIAHWTGTTTVMLNDSQRRELRDFVDKGGTLVIDSAGGSVAFSESVEAELKDIFGSAANAGLAHPLAADHPVYLLAGSKIDSVSFRAFSRKTTVGTNKTPRIRGILSGNRVGVFYSPEDLTAGLVGQQVDGVDGYDPVSATHLMTNIILYAAGKGTP
jgi:hypothetical protein